ncbi:hypothetical protein AB0C38_13725 [Amycolatopsis sp. NPDC048633]|uniref:hypothetical protein n=1 Tax=Amycolatopsis sp. NPDC048633 TaxID=3157095 RepID=UPI0033CD5BFE
MPEPILVSIAAALAAKGATSLYDLVKRKFAKDPEATAALEAASAAPADDPQPITALAERLHQAEKDDQAFANALRTEWRTLSESRITQGGVHNQVSGTVTGKVVQAGDVHGNISF